MTKIKICHITSVHRAEDVRIFHKECASLARAEYEVYLVQQGESYESKGVHIVGLGKQPAERLKRMTTYSAKAYKTAVALNCDIYHIHDPELLPYARKLKRLKKKVIYDVHESVVEDITSKEWLPKCLRVPMAKIYEMFEKRICSGLDAIISVTPHLCRKYHGMNEHTYMVTNYPIVQPLANEKRIDGQICFAGGIDRLWNHERIIDTISHIGGCKYLLMGKVYSEDYLEKLKKSPGWKQVVYLGLINHEEVYSRLCQSSIGVALLHVGADTNCKEGTLGNTKLFEEMMAGLPVICTDFDLWKDIVEKYECGICIDPNDAERLEQAIDYLMNNPEIAHKMGAGARTAIEREYNWDTQEKVLLGLYKEILE